MKKIIKIVLIVCICIGAGIGYIFYYFMWDTQSEKKGERLRSVESPEGNYIANISWHWRGNR